jgi:hypothetical protein
MAGTVGSRFGPPDRHSPAAASGGGSHSAVDTDRADVIVALTIEEKCEAALMAFEDLKRPVRALEHVMKMGEQLAGRPVS